MITDLLDFLAHNVVPAIWAVGICFGLFGAYCKWKEKRDFEKFDREQLAKSSKKNNNKG